MNKETPTAPDPCPHCGKNMNMVGKAHNCRPRNLAPVTPRKSLPSVSISHAEAEIAGAAGAPKKKRADPSKLAAVAARLKGRGSMKGKLDVKVGVDLGKPVHAQMDWKECDGPYFRDGKQVAPAVGASLPADDKIDTSDIPEATEEDFRRSKTTRLKPRARTSKSHPDCERCRENRLATAERLRAKRASP